MFSYIYCDHHACRSQSVTYILNFEPSSSNTGMATVQRKFWCGVKICATHYVTNRKSPFNMSNKVFFPLQLLHWLWFTPPFPNTYGWSGTCTSDDSYHLKRHCASVTSTGIFMIEMSLDVPSLQCTALMKRFHILKTVLWTYIFNTVLT